jgi:N-dimethylarginine dimethylaminohydrolase
VSVTVMTHPAPPAEPVRTATRREYLMCRPTHFAVDYVINPWMDPTRPVDVDRAVAQWETLRRIHLDLGHDVAEIEPVAGMPDMVFAANGGLVIGNTALGVRFHHPERRGEEDAFLRWFAAAGFDGHRPRFINEGEGDFLLAGSTLLAGTGFRSDRRAHTEAAALFGLEVLTLELVDARFYHLDTALCVLTATGSGSASAPAAATIAYWPGAFSPASRAELARRFPDAILATERDAAAFGLNAVSDGRHVILSAEATGFAAQLSARGFTPIGVDLSELRRAGGGAKCATLELHRTRPEPTAQVSRSARSSASEFMQ